MCLPYYIAKLYTYHLLPRRISHSLFYRSTRWSDCYRRHYVTHRVVFGETSLWLELPLQFQQNWTILFEDFDNEVDGLSLRLFQRYARRAKFVFDVGMNGGLYLYHAASVCPKDAKIYGFEPNSELARAVEKNVLRNQLSGTEIINKGVSSETGTAELFLTNTDHMSSLSREFIQSHGRPIMNKIDVEVVRLDDFVDQHDVKADLIKIDVEGMDADVISGAWSSIARYLPVLLIEISERNLHEEYITKLFNLGYRCFYLLSGKLIEIKDRQELVEKRKKSQENYLFTIETAAEVAGCLFS